MDEFGKKVGEVADTLGISQHLARELVILAGGSVPMVITASRMSKGLDQCKARILDMRFCTIEDELFVDVEETWREED